MEWWSARASETSQIGNFAAVRWGWPRSSATTTMVVSATSRLPNSEAFALGRPAGPVPYTPLEPIAKLISATIVRIMCPSRS